MKKLFLLFIIFIAMPVFTKEQNSMVTDYSSGWLPTAQYAPENKWNPNKNMVDAMIELFYQNPDAIAAMNENCKDMADWEARFVEEPHLSNMTRQCLTWEMNKKLSPEQQEALTWIKNPFEDVFYQLKLHSPVSPNELKCELVSRLYNIVMEKNLPECQYEVNKNLSTLQTPCNSSGLIKTLCYNQADIISCMKTELMDLYAKLSFTVFHKKNIQKSNQSYARQNWPLIDENKYRQQALTHMSDLLEKTEKMMHLIVPDPKKREKELIKIFNFYELTILYTNRYMVNYMTDGGLDREQYFQD